MRILMVSKFRKFMGGVESHLNDLSEGLRQRGHVVATFTSEDVESNGFGVFDASTRGAGRIPEAARLIYNVGARVTIKAAIKEFGPDLVHYHSIYHQLSPSVLDIFDGPTMMTLHDYKLAAPCYTLYRDGNVCTNCVGASFPIDAIRFKCIRGSGAASALCATEHVLHRRRYLKGVNRFIVPSTFSRDIMVEAGLPRNSIAIVPWGVREHQFDSYPAPGVALFAGRLHPTKGIRELLAAWNSLPLGHNLTLKIAGTGDLEADVLAASSENPSIEYLGLLSPIELHQELTTASLFLVPSLFPETMGLSALEALAARVPVVSSGRGALADLAGPGVWTLDDTSPSQLARAIEALLVGGEITSYREQLLARDLSEYTTVAMLDRMQAEYLELLREKKAS